jgi:hypothetical protein
MGITLQNRKLHERETNTILQLNLLKYFMYRNSGTDLKNEGVTMGCRIRFVCVTWRNIMAAGAM